MEYATAANWGETTDGYYCQDGHNRPEPVGYPVFPAESPAAPPWNAPGMVAGYPGFPAESPAESPAGRPNSQGDFTGAIPRGRLLGNADGSSKRPVEFPGCHFPGDPFPAKPTPLKTANCRTNLLDMGLSVGAARSGLCRAPKKFHSR